MIASGQVDELTDTRIVSSINLIEGSMELKLHSSLLGRLRGSTNQGERELMEEVLSALQKALIPDCPELIELQRKSIINDAVDRIMPLGQKKKLVILPDNPILRVDPTVLPNPRLVQKAEYAEILEGMGECLRKKGRKEGILNAEGDPNEALKEVVSYLYEELKNVAATLDAREVVPVLLAYQEANTRRGESLRFTIPTRLACFGDREDFVETLTKEHRDQYDVDLANRFLIEYVAASLHRGSQPLSLDSYDRLLALASQSINWGMLSESVHFQLVDIEVSILASGRLGFDRSPFESVYRSFFSNFIGGLITRSARNFDSQWNSPRMEGDGDSNHPATNREMDEAFKDEFGLVAHRTKRASE